MNSSRGGIRETSDGRAGGHVRWYATCFGWPIKRYNILVEGETDVRYFNMASVLHERSTGLKLLGSDVAVFAAGFGNEGGTLGIVERFPTFKKIVEMDPGENGRPVCRIVVLLDNDDEGQRACNYLTNRYSGLLECQDVFRLWRKWPQATHRPKQLLDELRELNGPWSGIECVIEDLVSREVLDEFINCNGGCLRSAPRHVSDGHHYSFQSGAKSRLSLWMKDVVNIKDMHSVIETLRALRRCFGLSPDGEK